MRVGTCMCSQLRGHGFNTRIQNLFWHFFWRFFWPFWSFFWRFFSITSAHDMHWTQSQTTTKKLGTFLALFMALLALFLALFMALLALFQHYKCT